MLTVKARFVCFAVCLSVSMACHDMVFNHQWAVDRDAQELKEANETYKLQMYRALAWTLGAFVTLFTTLAIILLTAQGSEQSWQWKWEWTQVVAWEVSLAQPSLA